MKAVLDDFEYWELELLQRTKIKVRQRVMKFLEF